MLTIIHGDDTATSRKIFLDTKQNHLDAQIFDGEQLTLTDLAQIFDGGELFSHSKEVYIENFLTKRKKSNERDMMIAALQNYAQENTIYLWEGKELEKSVLGTFKTAMVKLYKLPQSLFILVENIKPHNSTQLVSLFHQALATAEVEMVFFMLVRQLRILLALHDPSNEKIDELKRLAPWQVTRLQQQLKYFSSEQLLSLYDKLFLLEKAQKTGTLSSPLVSSIDFLLLEI
jgi:hypothetical protein